MAESGDWPGVSGCGHARGGLILRECVDASCKREQEWSVGRDHVVIHTRSGVLDVMTLSVEQHTGERTCGSRSLVGYPILVFSKSSSYQESRYMRNVPKRLQYREYDPYLDSAQSANGIITRAVILACHTL